ncbi:MAG: hypothetical protein ACNYWU_08405 [Desulfobacterales bacterium]
MIIDVKQIEKPVFGKDYDIGDIGFIHRTGIGEKGFDRFITAVISRFGSDAFAMFRPNHMFMVISKDEDIEADGHDEGRVRIRNIYEHFESNDLVIVKKLKPKVDIELIINKAKMLLYTKFDEAVIFYIVFEKLLGLEKLLRNVSPPKFGSGIMCSNYFGWIFNHFPEYKNVDPMNKKHWGKITPTDFYKSKDIFEYHPIIVA